MFENLPLMLAQDDPRPAPVAPGINDGAPHTTPGDAPGDAGTVQPGDHKNLPANQPKQPGSWMLPGMLLLFLVVMFGMTFLNQRKEKKKRRQMLTDMKKNDKIVTIGGVIGTVMEVRDSEIIVKVDESNNTRMRFSRAAIQSVISDSSELPDQ